MELLLSDIPPAKFPNRSTQKVWEENLKNSERIKIATGFISSDSLIDLKNIVEINKKPYVDILLGMHFFDGFTRQQYESASALNDLLESRNLGAVYLSKTTKFHGKMYSFADAAKKCFGAIVGSSNLSSMVKSADRLYEVDCFFTDAQNTALIDKSIDDLFARLGTKFSEIPAPDSFKTHNSLLENHDNVTPVSKEEYAEILATKTATSFNIEVKTESKSNLNVYFGKGRVNQRGFEMPRPWYEVEIIVSSTITKLPGYPANKVFTVYTDDGWSFKCFTNGDYSKNFRSQDNLIILGKWLKGRLEDSSALTIGEPVTAEVLQKYGNNMMKLTATTNPDVWLLDFKPNNG